MQAFDQKRADGRADHAAGDDADHRGGDGNGLGSFNARRFKLRGERQPGCRTAGQSHRTAQDAEERRLPGRPGGRRSDNVLQDRGHGAKPEKQQDLRAAFFQEAETCPKADGREEGDHQGIAKRHVELEQRHVPPPGKKHQKRNEQAPQNWGRQIVAGQHWHGPPESITQTQHHSAEGQGVNEIQFEHSLSISEGQKGKEDGKTNGFGRIFSSLGIINVPADRAVSDFDHTVFGKLESQTVLLVPDAVAIAPDDNFSLAGLV